MTSGAPIRVAVIEVGSRSVRLLVADLSLHEGLRAVVTRAAQTHLIATSEESRVDSQSALRTTLDQISQFREEATKAKAEKIVIFGTEAARRLLSSSESTGLSLISEIKVLDEAEEARCSLIAAVKGLEGQLKRDSEVLIIDQGGGSVELASGRPGPPVEMAGFTSLSLGSDKLLGVFREKKLNVKAFRTWVEDAIRLASLPSSEPGTVIALGSLATKCVWLTVRKDSRDNYDPRRVQGQRMSASALENMARYVERFPPSQWGPVRASVDPRNPNSDEFERVVTGSIVLSALLRRYQKDDFIVSASGTRFGMAWKIAGLA
jgi:exopolyphosphatase/guanosine-5'-triphosphate,3'-diphosphate pyrophosphatase